MAFYFVNGLILSLLVLEIVALRRLGLRGLSLPIWIFTFIHLFFGIFGYIFYFTFFQSGEDQPEGAISAVLSIRIEDLNSALRLFTMAVAYALGGCLIFEIVRTATTTRWKAAVRLNQGTVDAVVNRKWIVSNTSDWGIVGLAILFGLMDVVTFAIGIGPANIISRTEYLPEVYPTFRSIGSLLFPPTALAIGYGVGRSRPFSMRRTLLYAVMLVELLTLFSLATRALALFPILFTVGYISAQPIAVRKQAFVKMMFAVFAVALIIPVQLFTRASAEHGLIPYFLLLTDFINDGIELPSMIDSAQVAGIIAHNILFSFPLTIEVLSAPLDRPSIDLFLTSINPLPGVLTDWPAVQDLFRINEFTPFNSIGELALYGEWVFGGYYVMLGMFLGFANRMCVRQIGNGRIILPLVTRDWWRWGR